MLRLEDRFMRRLSRLPATDAPHVQFISELMSKEFARLYGAPARFSVEVNAPPPVQLATNTERRRARDKWAPEAGRRLVIGFLGGTHERKGFRPLLRAIEHSDELFLLFGGPNSDTFNVPTALKDKMKAVGFVEDVGEFFAACDAFIVSAPFEPLGMVALEAAAYGVPIVAGEGVGALPTLLQYGCATAWPQGEALEPLVRSAVNAHTIMNAGAVRMCAELGAQNYAKRLLALCEAARNRNQNKEKQ